MHLRPGIGLASTAPDLRLLPVVAGVWLAQAVVLLVAPSAPLPFAAAGAVLTAAAVVASLRDLTTRRMLRSGHGTAALLLAGGLGIGLSVGALHVARLHPPELRDAASSGAKVTATVRITGDPRAFMTADDGGRPTPPSWSAQGRLKEVTIDDRTLQTSVPVVLRGRVVSGMRYGSVVQISARAAPPYAPAQNSLTLRVTGQVHERSPPGPIAAATSEIREAFRRACEGLPVDAAALLTGLAVGDETLLQPELDQDMVSAGLAHLTAVSGSNTSLVAGITLAAVTALGWGWRWRVAACLLVLGLYVALVRPQPSVLRAAVMGLIALLALTTGGHRRGPPALLAACLALLIAVPAFAVSIGFALSASATAGLLIVGPPLVARLGRWPVSRTLPEPLRAALAVAMAAHLATLPLAVLLGNGASLVALPANVIVTPFVPPATVLGLAAALVAPIAQTPAAVMAHVAAPATGFIARVAHTAADVPHGVIPIPEGAAGALGVAGLLGLVLLAVIRRWRPWRHPVALLVVLTLALAWVASGFVTRARWPPADWVVLACDIGQGDAVLLRSPGSTEALLVDVGPDGRLVTDCIDRAGITRLVVMLTHFHADHVDGLSAVLADLPVTEVVTTPVGDPADSAAHVISLASRAGVPLRTVRAGDHLDVFGLGVDVLWPARSIAESAANNASVVALVTVPTGPDPLTALMTGDVEPEAQADLMARASPHADIVKIPHHGSRYQSGGFAAWTGAGIALVSVGRDNSYGHPSGQTLDAYLKIGADVGRTDLQGPLAVVPDGSGARLVPLR